jgi:Arc/MetJ-type ribon-helix-helix transcriptional regulator
MNMDIAPETERIVREELSSGHFNSLDELILASLQAWRERNPTTPDRGRVAGIDRARAFVAWVKSHPAAPPLSDDAVSHTSLNPDRW